MKKILLSLLFVALSTMTFAQTWNVISSNTPVSPKVSLVSSSEQHIVIDFSLGGFYLTQVSTPNGIQQIVSVSKMASMLEAGAPDLPQFPVPAIIGDMAEMEVGVINCRFTDYENVEIAPSKGNFSRQIDPASVPYTYGEMYSQNAFYPSAQAYLELPYIVRDFRGQNIMVRPFAYNPVTKTLRVYHNMTIAMKKVSDNGMNPKNARRAIVKVSPEMKASYEHRFINYKENNAKYPFLEEQGEMLVICADQFMASMQPFVDWKNQSGRPTTMVSVSEAGGNNNAQIKNYITNYYNDPDHNLVYVLLVGDYQHITPHPFTSTCFGSASTEYSDNWFGQVEGNDHYEEIFVGRISAENDTHVTNQVNKVIYYERDMKGSVSWINKGLGIGAIGAGQGHYNEDDYQHIDFIRDTLEHYTYEHVTDLHEGGGASNTSISAAINDGVSIINYCNHGSQTGWGVAGYSNSDVNSLVNDEKWPIVWSVACLCGQFNYGTQCFAEAWMRATDNTTGVPTGAVGGMFSWMSQPWVPPMYGQDEMVDILTEWKHSDNFNHTLGGASLNGNMYVIDMNSGANGTDTHDTWLLFGDPSMMVRTDNPTNMNLNVNPSVIILGMSTLEITAQNTPYGIATLMMDGEAVASGYIINGTCTLNITSLNNVGTATLTVMGYNKETEVLPVEVVPAEGPFVTLDDYSPNLAPVNTATNLSLSFKNVGVEPTNGNTNVTLTCNDQRLSFINNTASFGVLNAEESISLLDAFSLIVAEGVDDGTRFQINVEMTDGRQTWSGMVFITATQAALDYTGTNWAGGFVPGETMTLAVQFKNNGHYMATNAIANITCENEYVTLLNPNIEMGTIDPDGVATCLFNIQIDENCPETETIYLGFSIHADGNLNAEGAVTLRNACNVIFDLTDRWGDGWNGAKLTVGFDDGTASQELTVAYGSSSATYTIEISNGTHVTLTWTKGSYDSECAFVVKYEGSGQVIYKLETYQDPNAGLLYEFDCQCAGGQSISTYDPVENLVSTVGIGTVTLTWDEPENAINYIIIRNGIEIAHTENPTYIDAVLTESYYTYCVVAEYRNGTSFPECIVVKSELGIDENMSEFSIYPNPVNGTLFINGGNAEYSYTMLNGIGQSVANGTAKGIEQINVDGMNKGIYFLHLISGTQVLVEKIVVK